MGFIKFLFKIFFLTVLIIIASQLEIRGRKLETYVKEYIYSHDLDKYLDKINNFIGGTAVDTMKNKLDADKIKNSMEKIKEDERKELQNLMEE